MFSIITPTFNRAHLLKRTIKSVLCQTFTDFELIIVDDGSTDSTWEFLNQLDDKRIRIIKHELNKGVSAAKNTGLRHITHEWFTILDSDDEMTPNALECFYNVIIKDSSIEVITCNTRNSITKKNGGYGWTKEGKVDSIEVLKNFHGEHWGVIKTTMIGENKLNEKLGAFEGVFWTKITWGRNRYFISDALRIYHTDGTDRISGNNYYSIEKNYLQYLNLLDEKEFLYLLKTYSLRTYQMYLTEMLLAFLNYKDYKKAISIIFQINYFLIPIKKTIKILIYIFLGNKIARITYENKTLLFSKSKK